MMHTHELPLELFKRKVFDIIIYGHTHDLHIEKNHRSIIINPGECGGWLRTKATVVVADTDTLETEVIYLT
jgi:putative phosphoesterase